MTEKGSTGAAYDVVMDIADIPEAIAWQAEHAERAGSPGTARIVRGLLAVLQTDTAVGRRMRSWQGLTLQDAMPLRIHGGLHNLVLTGTDKRLERVYAGQITDQASVDRLVTELVEIHDARLLPWLDGPPQTNEAGRSASIMAGLLWLSEKIGQRFELNELGASAGVNTMMERYRYNLGGVKVGPQNSPMHIVPEWRGAPPLDNSVEIVAIRGCDQTPIDLSDHEAAMRLKSYVWPEATARMARIDAAIALASAKPPEVVQQDAGDFVQDFLTRDHPEGVARVMFHSIMWQYMPETTQAGIISGFEEAAAKATSEQPFAWLALETDPETFRHELKVRCWKGDNGDGDTHLLAFAHPHGAWVEWLGAD